MIIKEIGFSEFCKLFKDNADLVVGLGFSESSTVTVLLDHVNHNWIVEREEPGIVTISYSDDEGAWVKLGSLSVADFVTIEIC